MGDKQRYPIVPQKDQINTENTYDQLLVPGCHIEGVIAEGGMAVVYAAVQQGLERPVAVKVMKEGDTALIQRFLQEARLLAAINHRHVVTIHDVGVLDDGRPYITMERLAGGDLRTRIKAGLSDSLISQWMLQLVEALRAIHAEGIVHRDIKPANILFREDESLVLSDFGIARRHDVNLELTQTGTVVGSPAYSSPEQVMAAAVDVRSDQYSVGIVLLELLLGHNPYRAEQYATTLINQLQMPAPQLPVQRQGWQPVVDRLLAKSPEQRFPGMQELADAIQARELQAQDVDVTLVGIAALTPVPSVWRGRLQRIRRIMVYPGVLLLAISLVFLGEQWFRASQVRHWLRVAHARGQAGFLMTPAGDSALDWYRRVLQVAPANPEALQGLLWIERDFLQLAGRAEARHDWVLAHQLLDKAFMIRPGDTQLPVLYQELRHKKDNWELSQVRRTSEHASPRNHRGHAQHAHNTSVKQGIKKIWHRLFGT